MATIYKNIANSLNSELTDQIYVESHVPTTEAKKRVKKLNSHLNDEDKSVFTEYDYLKRDLTEEEFYNLF